jgi:hypothetical protein
MRGFRLDYGTDDDHGRFVGAWLLLTLISPEGDEASQLLSVAEARDLASDLLVRARIVEDRAGGRRMPAQKGT